MVILKLARPLLAMPAHLTFGQGREALPVFSWPYGASLEAPRGALRPHL